MKECVDCNWMQGIRNSRGEFFYICVNVESGAYMGETGFCGNCGIDEEEEKT
jgi:hypothetical protein